MAGESRGTPLTLKDELLQAGERFSFFQAMRLLRYYLAKSGQVPQGKDPIRELVKIRPKLSLAHPATDIDGIVELPDETPPYLMTVNILGLYGESSPLPLFYTEDLMEEAFENVTLPRNILDTINYPLYLLFFRCWTKYRLFLKVLDEKDPKYLDVLFSLLGLGVTKLREEIPQAYQLLRYIGLFTQTPKSALGLKLLLSDALNEPQLQIIPNMERNAKIPDDQKCYLGRSGNKLGRDCYLGVEIADRSRKYRVKIESINKFSFRAFLPEGPKYKKLVFLSRFYLTDPYESDLEVSIMPGEVETTRLGGEHWSRLGEDTWIFSGDYDQPVRKVIELN